MSSLWNFNALLKYLETLPKEKVYDGMIMPHNGLEYCSGCGFIMSPDVARLLLENRQIAESVKIIDDVDIGVALDKLGIKISVGRRTDVCHMTMYTESSYHPSTYHYRIRWYQWFDSQRHEEPIVMWDLLRKINNDIKM
jgi:hypothetical protein